MGSRSDLESENENTTIDLKNDEFVQLLEENKSLFDKSQNPGVQKRKRQSIERIQKKYIEKTNKFVSTQQIRKRICNMKAEVRKNLRNGNPMKLKEWHKKVIQLMSEHDDLVADVTGKLIFTLKRFTASKTLIEDIFRRRNTNKYGEHLQR